MSSRVVGAGLALVAAALLAVSIATPVLLPAQLSMFAGHPTVNGHTRELQEVYSGFYGTQGCNTGGDGSCTSIERSTVFKLAALSAFAVTAMLAVAAIALALLTLRKSERRKGVARALRVLAVIAAALAGAMIALGPTDRGSIPIGLGMGLYAAGVIGALLGSLLAVRPPPPLKLRVAGASQSSPAIGGPAPFDRQAMFRDGSLHPSGPGPAPMVGRDHWPRPGGAPPGNSAPAPNHAGGDHHRHGGASQLRPLYDAAPMQGGTGGLLPIERPALPTQPPPPMPRAAVSAIAGIPTPPPFAAEPRTLPPPSGSRTKPASIPPPFPPAPYAESPFSPPSSMSRVSVEQSIVEQPGVEQPSVTQRSPELPEVEQPSITQRSPERPSVTQDSIEVSLTPSPSFGTQVSLVPPMPEAHDAAAENEEAMTGRSVEINRFPRAETPLAPPPTPVAPPVRPRPEPPLAPPPIPPALRQPAAPPPPPVAQRRPARDSQPMPRPARDTQAPRSPRETESPRAAVRAVVPMPARPAPSPTRPPLAGASRVTPPRPTIHAPVAPPPSIPPIPALPRRAETEVEPNAPEHDAANGSRVPLAIDDHTSQTNVSQGMPEPEGEAIGGTDDAPHVTDTSPSGQPMVSGEPERAADAPLAAPPVEQPAAVAAPAVAASPPPVRDRPMPKLPISTAPDSLPPPRDDKQATGPSPACPQCESPMAWVEEHLRFYCKSCRMYF